MDNKELREWWESEKCDKVYVDTTPEGEFVLKEDSNYIAWLERNVLSLINYGMIRLSTKLEVVDE